MGAAWPVVAARAVAVLTSAEQLRADYAHVIVGAGSAGCVLANRLGRAGRLRTDLGGVYFNAIFALLAGGVYFATGEEAALLAASVQYVIILQQLLPLLRFDGYYVLSDLTGVPDILSRIKPIFRSLR